MTGCDKSVGGNSKEQHKRHSRTFKQKCSRCSHTGGSIENRDQIEASTCGGHQMRNLTRDRIRYRYGIIVTSYVSKHHSFMSLIEISCRGRLPHVLAVYAKSDTAMHERLNWMNPVASWLETDNLSKIMHALGLYSWMQVRLENQNFYWVK